VESVETAPALHQPFLKSSIVHLSVTRPQLSCKSTPELSRISTAKSRVDRAIWLKQS
jgi:hypothetical protein